MQRTDKEGTNPHTYLLMEHRLDFHKMQCFFVVVWLKEHSSFRSVSDSAMQRFLSLSCWKNIQHSVMWAISPRSLSWARSKIRFPHFLFPLPFLWHSFVLEKQSKKINRNLKLKPISYKKKKHKATCILATDWWAYLTYLCWYLMNAITLWKTNLTTRSWEVT